METNEALSSSAGKFHTWKFGIQHKNHLDDCKILIIQTIKDGRQLKILDFISKFLSTTSGYWMHEVLRLGYDLT